MCAKYMHIPLKKVGQILLSPFSVRENWSSGTLIDCIIALIRHWFFIYCSLVLYNCNFKFLLTFMINNGRIYFIFLKHGYLILFNPNWYKGSEFVLYSQTLQETVILQTKFFLIIKFWATINIRNLNNVSRLKNLT